MDNNDEVLKRARELKKYNNNEYLTRLMEVLSEAIVYVPGTLPEGTSPEVIKYLQSQGPHAKLPAGIRPNLAIVVDGSGNKYLAGFTSHEEIYKDPNSKGNVPPLIIGMPFKDCARIVAQSDSGLQAFVLNPYSENVVINIETNKNENGEKAPRESQDILIRRKIEIDTIPYSLFKNKDFIFDMVDNPEQTVKNIFDEAYGEQAAPYTDDDFDSLVLNMSDTLTFIRVNMPEKNTAIATAVSIFVLWNPQTDRKGYFVVVRDMGTEKRLFRVMPDGEKVDVCEAPIESNEIMEISDIFVGEEDE